MKAEYNQYFKFRIPRPLHLQIGRNQIFLMKHRFDIKNIESEFKKVVHSAILENPEMRVTRALELMVEFYSSSDLKNVDYTVADNDMLLFQYGIYDWHDGKGENFIVNFTRQFIVKKFWNEAFYQLRFDLYFPPRDLRLVTSRNIWSIEKTSIIDWAADVRLTQGFIQSQELTRLSHDIQLIKV